MTEEEPEVICECGHDHLRDWHAGMPPIRVMNKCPDCDCDGFRPTKESEIKYLEYWGKKKKEELEKIEKRLAELRRT